MNLLSESVTQHWLRWIYDIKEQYEYEGIMVLEQSIRPDSQAGLSALYTFLSSPQYQHGVLPAAQI